ncbi:hypothetical protein CYMTET_50652 [Cymbomonas tetramitiformis]|uniref:Uncharacterized protein n=1 Tax=Cymbomonas tetramitiformis TaxID=36881 RepID=A0AAE0BPB7_9CHLO|nr:hypothetical protein CYMTET_50652 [Cymbomonas tetramitiformis]
MHVWRTLCAAAPPDSSTATFRLLAAPPSASRPSFPHFISAVFYTMVATRLTSSMASRRRSLATIFDSAAARNSVTPATPATPSVPAANSAQAVFLAGVRSLTRERFDESVAKHVIRKCFREKHDRFTGTESNAQVLISHYHHVTHL